MALDKMEKGRILVEIKTINIEKVLNACWNRNIKIYKVKRKDIATLLLEIDHINYNEVCDIVRKLGGRIYIIESTGVVFFLDGMKKKISLVLGGLIFLISIYYLSTYVWSVNIEVQKNIPPFEVRKQLSSIGIKPGIPKKEIDVKEIERKLENMNSDILWMRARIEGSTLKIVIQEKINPPQNNELQYGNLVASMEGEVKRVYAFSGKPKVKPGQVVKAGEVVIEGIDGNEELKYILPPSGIVIANTFYEKSMQIQVAGTSLERSGVKDSDIYISILGKKIYLKKSIKDFQHYDKIDLSGKIFNKVLYYERVEKEVKVTEEEAIKIATSELQKSLLNDISRDAKIVDKIVDTEMKGKESLIVRVMFVVEQNIVDSTPVDY